MSTLAAGTAVEDTQDGMRGTVQTGNNEWYSGDHEWYYVLWEDGSGDWTNVIHLRPLLGSEACSEESEEIYCSMHGGPLPGGVCVSCSEQSGEETE